MSAHDQPCAILRAGDVQILTYWEGANLRRRLKAKVTRVIPEEVLKANPDAAGEWTIEEISILGRLCKEAVNLSVLRQSIDVEVSQQAMEPKPDDSEDGQEEDSN